MIIYGFKSRSRIFHLYGDVTIAGDGMQNYRPMLGAQGLRAGRDLYCATPAVTRDLGFSGLIRRTDPFSSLLRHTRGCGGSILTRILTGGATSKNIYHSCNNTYISYSFISLNWLKISSYYMTVLFLQQHYIDIQIWSLWKYMYICRSCSYQQPMYIFHLETLEKYLDTLYIFMLYELPVYFWL
jgi:hypothetical protein